MYAQRRKDLHHEEQEADEDVGVEAILLEDRVGRRADDIGYPAEEGMGQGVDTFAVDEREY